MARFLASIAISLVFATIVSGLEIRKCGELPSPRTSAAAVHDAAKSLAYILGGVAEDGTKIRELLIYDLSLENPTPTIVEEFPAVSHGAAVIDSSGDVFYFGGGDINEDAIEGHIYKVTFDAGGKPSIFTFDYMEHPATGMTAHFIPPNSIYLFGGRNKTHVFKRISKFTILPTGLVEEAAGELPLPLTKASSVLHNGKVYIFGGWDFNDGNQILSHEIFEYDPANPTQVKWSAKLLQGSESAVAVQAGPFSYVIGGLSGGDMANQRVTEFNPETKEVKEICVKEEYRFVPQYASGIYADDHIYIFGGYTNQTVKDVLCIPVSTMIKNPCPPGEPDSAMNVQQSISMILVMLFFWIQQEMF